MAAGGSGAGGHGLRPGQAEGLRRWRGALRRGSRSELIVVPVGYGKTVLGVGSWAVARDEVGSDVCLYLTPTDVLRTQVYHGVDRALELAGIQGLPVRKILADNAAFQRVSALKANFIVASYQQVVAAPGVYQRLCRGRRVHVVADEAHHLGERGRWAEAVTTLGAQTLFLLSATPVRLDRDAIAGARYEEDEEGLVVSPLLHVSMRQAWEEGHILKHLNMQLKDYAVQLRDAAGEVYEFTASEMAELPDFDQRCVRQQLRWNDDYVQPLVREFALTLQAKLAMAPGQHQGLVFAATTAHADHLARVLARHHPSLRCVVVHSGEEIADAENARRLRAFHEGKYDVLIQVRKASEGFDAPTVSVLLKLDAVFSREPVIQQLGRGLRYNHALPEAQNLLNVFVGRDPRLAPIIEHLERETPFAAAVRREANPDQDANLVSDEEVLAADDDEPRPGPEIVEVVEAGDAYLDHTGRLVEGQQLAMFGFEPAAPPRTPETRAGAVTVAAPVEVVDLAGELQQAIEYCRVWTNRAARARGQKYGDRENHHAALNLAYGRATGRRGALATAAEYRHKGDWMKRRYLEFTGG